MLTVCNHQQQTIWWRH